MTSPKLPDAIYGTALGQVAAEVTENTEADPTAVLLHLLAGTGAATGTNAYADWSGRHTPARIFGLVIGQTGGGKGLAEHVALRLLRGAVPNWTDENIVGGLVSGEGLLAALGGDVDDENPLPGDGPPLPKITTPIDHALLVIEPEFGRVLAASNREGATLSHLLRELWDKDTAASLSRQRPLRVKGAHLGIVGHVTPTELRRLANTNAIENGLLNRFMPVTVTRGELQPFGTPPSAAAAVQRERHEAIVRDAIEHGRRTGRVDLDPDARDLWGEIYREFAPERPFLLGALLARGVAHIQRVALLLALGDRDTVVRRVHLDAAVALWRRSAAAWSDMYGEEMGDKLTERLMGALTDAGAEGLTRAEIRQAVGSNNTPAIRIETALGTLREAGYAEVTKVSGPSGGRPAEIWTAAGYGNNGNDGKNGSEGSNQGVNSLSSLSSHTSHSSHGTEGAA